MLFQRGMFSQMRRAGFGSSISKTKLTKIMIDILLQLPIGTQYIKETIIQNMGFTGQMVGNRDLNEAWAETKKKAAKEYPEKFILGDRDVLIWNDGTTKILDKKISPVNIKKLNNLAEMEGCTINEILNRMVRVYFANREKKICKQEE